jgi:hypothetical protein
MAISRASANLFNVGNTPPSVVWTIVRGDTAAFKVYTTDDAKNPLNISDWFIEMQFKRPVNSEDLGVITDNATPVITINPEADEDDGPGEFTVSLTELESQVLRTGDIFDIELSTAQRTIVWTVAQGSVVVLKDVTDPDDLNS